jgi:hypothetical protein
VAGTTSGQSWPSDDTRLAAFKWLEDAKKDLPLRAESAVEIQALRDKLSAATRRSDKEADLVAKAVNDVIVAKVEKKGTTGIALPRPRDGATVHQELYRAHQARLKELEERRDSLKVRCKVQNHQAGPTLPLLAWFDRASSQFQPKHAYPDCIAASCPRVPLLDGLVC